MMRACVVLHPGPRMNLLGWCKMGGLVEGLRLEFSLELSSTIFCCVIMYLDFSSMIVISIICLE